MEQLKSQIDTTHPNFSENHKFNQQLVSDLNLKLDEIREGGPRKLREKHISRNKLLVRQRIEKLLDPHTPFLELSALAGWDQYNN